MAVTMQQIARRCGISRTTVSFALNNKGHLLNSETLRRVLQAADEMGYRPNPSAVAMRTGRYNCLGVLFSAHMYMPLELLHGLDAAMAGHNMHASIAELPGQLPNDPAEVPKILRSLVADGLLVNFTRSQIPADLVAMVRDAGMPAVWLNVKERDCCVYPDDEGAARQVVARLVALGHRRIAYASLAKEGEPDHYSRGERYRGVIAAAREAGASVEVVREALGADPVGRIAAARALLGRPDHPTAVVCYGVRTLSALHVAATQLSLSVPGDVSLVTFDDHVQDTTGLRNATAIVPWHAVANQAVELLLDCIEAQNDRACLVAVPYSEFDAGQTLARCSDAS